jgi:hypothetical protein
MNTSNSTNEIIVKMVLNNWNTALSRVDAVFSELSNEELYKQIAPGKNRGIYILGHLTAIHDRMIPLLGPGKQHFPELFELFVTKGDNPSAEIPEPPTLRESWQIINQLVEQQIKKVKTNEWLEKHTAVSKEEFVKEPSRNKLNVIINRTVHLSYHLGQLALLKKKKQ